MANLALESASSGLSALNTKLDVIANNLANVNTAGFKASRANFQDLLYVERGQPGAENANGDQRPAGLYVGLGVKVSGTQLDFDQGAPMSSNRELDVMIDGRGFFQVQVEDSVGTNGLAYTRAGNFEKNADGELVLANDQGRRLVPTIQIPPDAQAIRIESDGRVLVSVQGQTEPTVLGPIQIALFINPSGLKQVGENLYVESTASGPPITGEPATENFGRLRQNQLEASNVDPTRELVDLIRTQRAFEMNSQSIRAADDALRTISQLRR